MTVLLGSSTLGNAGNDYENATGSIGSFYVANATGTVDTITLRTYYTGTFLGPWTIMAAVYANSSGAPGAIIGNRVQINAPSGASTTYALTKSAPGANAAVVQGTQYWIAIWCLSSRVYFGCYDKSTSGGTKEHTGPATGGPADPFGTVNFSYNEKIEAYAEDSGVSPSDPATYCVISTARLV